MSEIQWENNCCPNHFGKTVPCGECLTIELEKERRWAEAYREVAVRHASCFEKRIDAEGNRIIMWEPTNDCAAEVDAEARKLMERGE